MPIASPWYRFSVRRPEKTSQITTLLNPGFMEGNVLDVQGTLYIVTKITHEVDHQCGTSTMEVVEPGWVWKMKYKFKRFVRTVLQTITRNWRRFRAERRDG